MAPKRSKRQRKQKDLGSLKQKYGKNNESFDPNSFILDEREGKHEQNHQDQLHEEEKPKLTKSQQRKMKKIMEEKERRAQRAILLETLSKHRMDDSQLSLMRSVASRGQVESKKQMLQRALKMEKAGVEVPDDMRLYKVKENTSQGSVDEQITQEEKSREKVDVAVESSVTEASIDTTDSSEMQPLVGVCDSGQQVASVLKDAGELKDLVAKTRKDIAAMSGRDTANNESDDEFIANDSSNTKVRDRRLSKMNIIVERSEDIDKVRSNLPIIGMEQEIMEAVSRHDVVILCGETGCGKTTQVPQFLYEAGYNMISSDTEVKGLIGITQPRRVAAVSTATRVSEELGHRLGGVVGYHVRYDLKISDKTALKFMTDGILLRELQDDFMLKKYNVIVIDEAHERSLNTDVLLGMLSRVVSLRRSMYEEGANTASTIIPLKLIIMSATLRIEDFVQNKRLFKELPPVVNVPARQYPVAVHFQKRTELEDYVGAAFKKTCQIHRNLPSGGILVFLTGQREVQHLCKRLRMTFCDGQDTSRDDDIARNSNKQSLNAGEYEIGMAEVDLDDDAIIQDYLLDDIDDLDDPSENSGSEEDDIQILNGDITEETLEKLKFEERNSTSAEKVWVLPLYAMLSSKEQQKVFAGAPEGHRLIIVSTNVAETSLTIPGIRYVVDAGRSKQRILESNAGLAKYDIRWISKASAEQRAGRAGRMGPGHCYRIFSSAVYNDIFPTFSPPEVLNVPLEGLVLLLKHVGVEKVENFPFPTPPNEDDLRCAIKCLISLSALNVETGRLTELGVAMAKLPISPRHSRLLLDVLWGGVSIDGKPESAFQKRDAILGVCVALAIRLTAMMSVESPFVLPSSIHDSMHEKTEESSLTNKNHLISLRHAHKEIKVPESDPLSAMKALCAFEQSGGKDSFCRENFLILKNLREGLLLTHQIERIIKKNAESYFHNGIDIPNSIPPKRLKQEAMIMDVLKRAITAGWGDRIAKRVRSIEYLKRKQESSSRTKAVRYETSNLDEDIFLHPNSTLHSFSPDWVVFTEVIRTDKRPYMVNVTAIQPQYIARAAPAVCSFSKPLTEPCPLYNVSLDTVVAAHNVTLGPQAWELPLIWLPYADKMECCAIFGAALLEGKVIKSFNSLKGVLAIPASMLARPEMRSHRRVLAVVTELQRLQVSSLHRLQQVWASNPRFLKDQLKQLIKSNAQHGFDKKWSEIMQCLK